jgi:hypothetical protein
MSAVINLHMRADGKIKATVSVRAVGGRKYWRPRSRTSKGAPRCVLCAPASALYCTQTSTGSRSCAQPRTSGMFCTWARSAPPIFAGILVRDSRGHLHITLLSRAKSPNSRRATQAIRPTRNKMISGSEARSKNSPKTMPYSLHDPRQYHTRVRKSDARLLLNRSAIFQAKSPAQTVRASPKEAQSFPELRPITTLVFSET